MKLSLNAVTLSLLILFIFHDDQANRVEAAKLRRGSTKPNEEIEDISLSSPKGSRASDERSLLSVGTLTDAELFAMKKTPPGLLRSSKCGMYPSGDTTSIYRTIGVARNYHPGCTQFHEGENDKGGIATLPPIGAPTSVGPTPMPTTASPTTPLPTMSPTTPMPSAAPTEPLNCVQTVMGNELTIPPRTFFRTGEVHCLQLNNGLKAYFGYNRSNQFGLFVNGQAIWTAPEASVAASDKWIFQADGNMLLRDDSGAGMWRTHTGGNWNSNMKVSFERVWIESNKGSTLWFQPLVPVPTAPPLTDGGDLPTAPPVLPNLLDNLFCVQTVTGNQLIVPTNEVYHKGDLHCLVSDDGNVAYFGYSEQSNEFGLFVNSESVWTVPDLDSFFMWNFQVDGNLVVRNSYRSNIWRSETPGNNESRLMVSFHRVWIESTTGSTIWYQPPYVVTPMPSLPSPPSSSPTMSPTTSQPSALPTSNSTPSLPTTGVTTSSPTATVLTTAPTPQPTTPLPTTDPTPYPTTSPPTTAHSSSPTRSPTTTDQTSPPAKFPTLPLTPPPTILSHTGLNCVQTVVGDVLTIPAKTRYYQGEVHCLISADGQAAYFGHTWNNEFGFFSNAESLWTVPRGYLDDLDRWDFQDDGNIVLRDSNSNSVWTSATFGNYRSHLRVSFERVFIEKPDGEEAWSQPPYLGPPRPVPEDGFPDPNGALQYYAYYYPWYHRNNWSRHGYQDEPLLGKYGTNEVHVAEQHIEWALETGITSWVVSYWGQNHLAMKHFKAGMINAPSINKIKFCMLYESVILDGRGSWYDGSKEDSLYQDLKVIRDEFFDHPSYLRINGRPVIIFYITRSRMPFQRGFDGPKVLKNMRERLGHDIYFIADEPFFNPWNRRPSVNDNAFQNGEMVFDAYTTYNMYLDDRVRDGETATTYQLREGMPIWRQWAEKVPMFPNVMGQYYDFRGNKPLIGNGEDFMKQLREVACLPRTNFNGAPHIMFITSFNEWWEGTQIEPEDGSPDNWNNYGFEFMETLATFKKLVDKEGTYWCNTERPSTSPSVSPTHRPSTNPTAPPSASPNNISSPSRSPTVLPAA